MKRCFLFINNSFSFCEEIQRELFELLLGCIQTHDLNEQVQEKLPLKFNGLVEALQKNFEKFKVKFYFN